ncbi:MAG TPA: prepilin-type N-terminal cleavage/methylation domain-containing protein [Accumulibacter sp.]|jgi:prepilin-type N-terminal cleavage/methylation domain-containing protein|nr:prepilin-type N-terminal cleavage/methylation domain-containing protein [Accumulibacter sp.]
MRELKNQQSGFTLVEIAIVLVIIGLLLGGVLKGQELINSAKVKRLIEDFRSYSTMVYAYQDRFKSMPGDQNSSQLSAAFGTTTGSDNAAVPVATSCNPAAANKCASNNGRIDGSFTTDGVTDETYVLWQHLRLANLATGPTVIPSSSPDTTGYVPRNSEGGRIGIQSAPFITGMRGAFFVCSSGIAGRFVKQIEITMDDGNTATGSVQAVSGDSSGAPVANNTVNDSDSYTVCVGY